MRKNILQITPLDTPLKLVSMIIINYCSITIAVFEIYEKRVQKFFKNCQNIQNRI